MGEWTNHLLERIKETERIIREMEPQLNKARESLLLYKKLYALETEAEVSQETQPSSQLEIAGIKSKRKLFEKKGRLSIAEATQQMLRELQKPLHGKDILAKLPAYGAQAKSLNSLWATLSNKRKLFKNIGNNTWILRKDASPD